MSANAAMRRRVLALALLVVACAPGGRVEAPAPAAAGEGEAVEEGIASIEVENNTTYDVSVFVLTGTSPERLGTVSGMGRSSFELPPAMVNRDIRFHARPIGARIRSTTETMRIRPGQVVSWRLDNKLRSYRLAVY